MKALYTFLLIFSCTFPVFSQTVFAPPGAVWYFEYIKDLDPSGLNYSRHESEKDTLFEGKLCSKIIGKRVSINASGNGYDTLVLPTQYTYTIDDTVFYYNHNFSQFYPLYIFNVKEGDTIEYHVPYMRPPSTDTTFKVIVGTVDEVVIGGQKLRRIRHRDYYSSIFRLSTLYERMGADGQSIIGYHPFPTHPYFAAIKCYHDHDIDVNVGLWGYSCDGLAPLSLKGSTPAVLQLFPNPALDKITISYPAGNRVQFEIMDVSGRTFDVPQEPIPGGTRFDIHNLADGLYFLKVSGLPEAGTGILKFLKTSL